MSTRWFFGILVITVAGATYLNRSEGAGPMNAQNDVQQFVFDMPDLQQQRASAGGPWLQFLDVPAMYCGIYHLEAGSQDGQSPHADDEVYYVQSGKAKFHMDGEEFDIGPGMVLYVPAGKKHFFHDIQEDLTLLVIFARGPETDSN